VAVGVLFAAAVGYGLVRLDHPAFQPGPRVAAIQGSVPQFQKMTEGDSLGKQYGKLHMRALAGNPRPDLIVWPETCFPLEWFQVAKGSDAPPDVKARAEKCINFFTAQPWGAPVLLGVHGEEWENGREWKYNSAVLLGADRKSLGRYDKMHLVPFGEYVPFKDTLPWMKAFTPYDWDYSCRPGEHWTRFPLTTADGRKFTFGCLICYEAADPSLARNYVASDPVNFLVNISNDGWFDGTEEHEGHLAVCRLRAVEARRSMVRAVNMGISGVIDSDGRVVALPADSWSGSKKMEAVVSAVVPIDDRGSWYARLGDWLPAACWGLLVIGHCYAMVQKRRAVA
jgi:apolipoprotein N-acyltransferase